MNALQTADSKNYLEKTNQKSQRTSHGETILGKNIFKDWGAPIHVCCVHQAGLELVDHFIDCSATQQAYQGIRAFCSKINKFKYI